MYLQNSEVTASFLAGNFHEAPQPETVSATHIHHLGTYFFSPVCQGRVLRGSTCRQYGHRRGRSGHRDNSYQNWVFSKGTKGSFYVFLLQAKFLLKWKLYWE